MLNDTARTVEEQYTRATTSSNLRCKADERSDVDLLIAAGCTPGILGSALMRLHSEFDGSSEKQARTATDAILLMGKLKSLPRVLEALEGWALLHRLRRARPRAHCWHAIVRAHMQDVQGHRQAQGACGRGRPADAVHDGRGRHDSAEQHEAAPGHHARANPPALPPGAAGLDGTGPQRGGTAQAGKGHCLGCGACTHAARQGLTRAAQ